MPRQRSGIVAFLLLTLASAGLAGAGESVATRSLTILPTGPRSGKTGEAYFNVEGKANGENGKYASYGILEFPAEAVAGQGRLTLTLTQSVARFSVDGPIRFYLATGALETQSLKFDPSHPEGLADQIPKRAAIGSGTFKKGETGKADPFELTLGDEAVAQVKACAEKKEPIRLVVVPGDEAVAATYFGAGAEQSERRPKLSAGAAR